MSRIFNNLRILLAVAALLGILLGGCAGMHPGKEQATLQPDTPDSLMEGPGLFSGENGGFTIYKR